MLISQMIIAPLMVLLAWGYLGMRPAGAPTTPARVFDGLVILLGVALCALAYRWVGDMPLEGNPAVWRPVFSTLSTFVTFPLVLFLGWWLRNGLFQA